LISGSAIPLVLLISLVRRSRVGFAKLRIRTTSYQVHVSRLYHTIEARVLFYLIANFILLHTPEIEKIIEMQSRKLRFSQNLMAELASALHNRTEHLVVRPACE
jgi:hypothetical protein